VTRVLGIGTPTTPTSRATGTARSDATDPVPQCRSTDSLEFVRVDRVVLAEPRGFCAGVEMAIKALAWMVKIFEPPVYCYHEIVHNKTVVDRFRSLGVVFVDDITEVPEGAPVMLSAHGSAPEVVEQARSIASVSVNAVCPLVTKVHHELKVRARKGYTVVYVGHEGHDEAVGTMAVAPQAVRLVETRADVEALDDPGTPIALLAQTTLSHDDWSDVLDATKERFPEMWVPQRSDLCFATTNRQTALRAVAARADAAVVVGSANSSNTVALAKVATAMGVARVVRVGTPEEVPDDLEGIVAVTAGASAPDDLVQSIIDRLNPAEGVEVVSAVDEDEYFPPPRELRDVVSTLALASTIGLGAPAPQRSPLDGDRDVDASVVLAGLATHAAPVPG
jgi:4-hydroxy-3-methylbut-2-enyl diphosphate reductase